jgi:hypothetical protein
MIDFILATFVILFIGMLLGGVCRVILEWRKKKK